MRSGLALRFLLSSTLCTAATADVQKRNSADLLRPRIEDIHVTLVARFLPGQITTFGTDSATATVDGGSTATSIASVISDDSTSVTVGDPTFTTTDDSFSATQSTSAGSTPPTSTTAISVGSLSSSVAAITASTSSISSTFAISLSSTQSVSASSLATNTTATADSVSAPFNHNPSAIAATAVILFFLVAGIAGITLWQIRNCLANRRDEQAEALREGGGYAALQGNIDDLEDAGGSHTMRELASSGGGFGQQDTGVVSLLQQPTQPEQPGQRRGVGYQRVVSNCTDGLRSNPHSRPVSVASSSTLLVTPLDPTEPYTPSHRPPIRRSIPSIARSDSFERSITPPQSAMAGPAGLPSQRRQHQRSGSSSSGLRRNFSFERPVSPAMPSRVSYSHGQVVAEPQRRVKSFSANVMDAEGVERMSPVSLMDHHTGWAAQ